MSARSKQNFHATCPVSPFRGGAESNATLCFLVGEKDWSERLRQTEEKREKNGEQGGRSEHWFPLTSPPPPARLLGERGPVGLAFLIGVFFFTCATRFKQRQSQHGKEHNQRRDHKVISPFSTFFAASTGVEVEKDAKRTVAVEWESTCREAPLRRQGRAMMGMGEWFRRGGREGQMGKSGREGEKEREGEETGTCAIPILVLLSRASTMLGFKLLCHSSLKTLSLLPLCSSAHDATKDTRSERSRGSKANDSLSGPQGCTQT